MHSKYSMNKDMILQTHISTHPWSNNSKPETLLNPASGVDEGLQAVYQLKQPKSQDGPSQEGSPYRLSLRAMGGGIGKMPGSG